MVFASPNWVEVGDEWWIYYAATDGGHSDNDAKPGIGLARIRKEGFVSMHSPPGGGAIVTKLLRWPGGKLRLNADSGTGEIAVLVSDYDRKPISGFSAMASRPVLGDSVRHEVTWEGADANALNGKVLRLEFRMKGEVDLYGFQVVPESN